MTDDETPNAPTELMVCLTCRAGREMGEDETRPGARLHAELAAMDWPEGMTLTGTDCFSNCDQGCSVVLRGGGKRWTYVYGKLDETMAETVHDGAMRYHATANGLVPWRERSVHFRKNCIARIPPLETSE